MTTIALTSRPAPVVNPLAVSAISQALADAGLAAAPAAPAAPAAAPAAPAPAAPAPAAPAMVHHSELSNLVLTRGQIKALAYAKKMQQAGTIDVLQESGNKTDKALAHEIFMQGKRAKARGNGNAIFQMVKNRYGSDDSVRGVACPDSAKTAALKMWVADCQAAIRGKDDSTEKAVASREAGFNARFGDLFLMIQEL